LPIQADPFAGYAAAGMQSDLYGNASANVASKWATMAQGLAALADGNWARVHDDVARQIQDLGLSFRMMGDTDERSWPLNPMPLVIGSSEWDTITKGLVQRADLLEQVIADIYGEQRLVGEGHMPASLITGSRNFQRSMIGVAPKSGHYLHVYAVDIARGPDGTWRVLADRVNFASGIGYALENRLALSRSTGSLLSDIHTRRLADFYSRLRAGIAADCDRDDPRIALLTPGRFNQSYPEQAHLARYLGFPLVEGRDLTVSNDKCYVRTIAGPKRIDAIWRWINTQHLDPLAFDSRSQIGVPDLKEAWSNRGLVVANWPGTGVVEGRAFAAFLPRLAEVLLGESLDLPNVATWWCGQQAEAQLVREHIGELVIGSAFGHPVEGLANGHTRAGANMTDGERQELLAAIDRRPMDYCAEEIVHLSTTPVLIEDRMEPRPFTIRAFVVRDGHGEWSVMPGGFARLAFSGALRNSLIGEGDLSADICIVDDSPVAQKGRLTGGTQPHVRRGGGILSSQAADNFFWFSRYSERAEMTVRVLRSLLGGSIDADGGSSHDSGVTEKLVGLLVQWGAVAAADKNLPIAQICGKAFTEREKAGGVEALIATSRAIGRSLRDRFTNDFWRIANRSVPSVQSGQVETMLKSANLLIERFAALSGLAAENMVRSPSWRFFEMGKRLERALNTCRIVRRLADGADEAESLGVLLDLADSQIVYRSRYLTGPLPNPVLDLVLLDSTNARSVVFQLEQIVAHMQALPTLSEDGIPEQPLQDARAILATLQNARIEALDHERIQEIEMQLLSLSDSISARYFLQYQRQEKAPQDNFLA
jgi:uncharacterized circularly permuted ATP-grasp superfamily protein/uncharacterized alpha-E superfamily protein